MHFQQSKHWKKLKESVGNETFQFSNGWAQITKVPILNVKVGYVPPIKVEDLDYEDLYTKAKAAGCAFVTIDYEEVEENEKAKTRLELVKTRSVRLQNNVINNLDGTTEELFNSIPRKVRYNIRYAEKNGVKISFNNSDDDFEKFLKLFLDTKNRHKFYGRGEIYLRKVWQIFKEVEQNESNVKVILGNAHFENKLLASWFLVGFEDTVYYPYGGSSIEHSNLKATYLMAYSALKWAKENGFKKFDWMGMEENSNDGFSAFKKQFGGEVVKYRDSEDLVIDKKMYNLLKVGRSLREKFSFLKNLT